MKHTYSAGGIIINPRNEILLLNEDGLFWGFPKGRIESGESTIDAARREIQEETGLTELTYIAELGSYERHPSIDGQEDLSELKHITLFLFTTGGLSVKENQEGNETTWVAADKAPELLTQSADKQFLQNNLSKITNLLQK